MKLNKEQGDMSYCEYPDMLAGPQEKYNQKESELTQAAWRFLQANWDRDIRDQIRAGEGSDIPRWIFHVKTGVWYDKTPEYIGVVVTDFLRPFSMYIDKEWPFWRRWFNEWRWKRFKKKHGECCR